VGLTADQSDALEQFQVEMEDLTPAPLLQAVDQDARSGMRAVPTAQATQGGATTPAVTAGGSQRVPAEALAASSDQTGRDTARAASGAEAEVPLAQGRDSGTRAAAGAEAKAATPAQPQAAAGRPQPAAPPAGAAKAGNAPVNPAQAARKGQPGAVAAQGAQGGQATGGQRYGTTRLRISVAGKYTEATVANGKIVVGGRSFDSPDQAAAELTKSRGDWTFWEYYDSADGKWRMLTRDWDTVLKSATPGGR
jgi:hypothetical protein